MKISRGNFPASSPPLHTAVKSVGDAAVMALALCCPRLESVALYWNLQLRDPALQALAARALWVLLLAAAPLH